MIPKKAKDIIKELCKKHDIDEAFMEDAVSFYWKEMRIKLSKIDHPHVYVAKFGTFNMKQWKVEQLAKDFGSYVGKMDDIVYASDEKRRSMRSYHKALLTMKNKLRKEKKVFNKIKSKRHGQKHTGNMEQQEQHPGGNKE